MAKKAYVGVSGTPKNIKAIYVGVNGEPKKVVKGYVGVNGVPCVFWDDSGGVDTLNVRAKVSVHEKMEGALNITAKVSIHQ